MLHLASASRVLHSPRRKEWAMLPPLGIEEVVHAVMTIPTTKARTIHHPVLQGFPVEETRSPIAVA